jgi:hypothetical protein
MFSWGDVEAQLQRAEELRRQAEYERWTRSAVSEAAVADRVFWRLLDGVGGWFIDVGCRMQSRVEHMREVAYQASAPLNAGRPAPCKNS